MRLFKPRFGQLNRKCTGVQLFTLEFYLTMFYPTPKPPLLQKFPSTFNLSTYKTPTIIS